MGLLLGCSAPGREVAATEPGGYVEPLVMQAPAGVQRVVPAPCGRATAAALAHADGSARRVRLVQGQARFSVAPPCPPRTAPRPAGALPDGEISTSDGPIAAAWLAEPTTRYRHGILGDAVEAGALHLRLRDGALLRHRLAPDAVFEDRRARIVDLGRDGNPEVLVIHSGLDSGGSLVLFSVVEGELRPVARSEDFGRANRWLNVVGVADYDGDGRDEIAAVRTPHLGGVLTLFERERDRLRREHAAPGFSNHAIGSRELDMAATLDVNGDGVVDLLVPDADRKTLRIVTFAGGVFRELQRIRHDEEIATAIGIADLDADGRQDLLYGLEGGRLVLLRRR